MSKEAVALILGKIKGKKPTEEAEGEPMGPGEDSAGKEAAIQAFFEAGKAGDYAGASSAFDDLMELC